MDSVSISSCSDNLDGAVHLQTRGAQRRHRLSGGGGQLPAAEPHRSADGRHMGHHEGRRGDILRPARCTESTQQLYLYIVENTPASKIKPSVALTAALIYIYDVHNVPWDCRKHVNKIQHFKSKVKMNVLLDWTKQRRSF